MHCTEGGLYADELREAGCTRAVVGPIISDRSKPELSNQSIENAARLHKAGIEIAICTDHPVIPIQYLPLSAGVCIKGGLDKEEALKAITINPARIAEIDDRVGSIEVGKDADLSVLDGEFYDVLTKPVLVLIDGKEVR